MKNTYFNAKLISLRKINIHIFSSLPKSGETKFYFQADNQKAVLLKITRQVFSPNLNIFELELPFDYPFGYNCTISSPYLGIIRTIDISNAINFPEFDLLFNYYGDDLGANYKKDATTFVLWAPLASSVFLMLENKDGSFSYLLMNRGEKGTYRLKVDGNLLNRKYHYIVNNSGTIRETNDPFGKGTSLDSMYSAVVDIEKYKKYQRIKPKRVINKSTDASIYELHIRDFTISKSSNIENKGKYLGLVEPNRKTPNGNPAGLDYLKFLGVSHIQLQPILDYQGPDFPNLNQDYNWGYDPISFFALEGSYSNQPDIPQVRLDEFRELVDNLHKNNLRVTIDVVYNHLYDSINTSFEKVVPGYFFRHRPNGLMSQASGCGNDFASEKYMAKKAILASVKYLFETFDIDGLRFDLMGLLDIDTIKKVVNIAKEYKKDALIYGEGWNMGNELPYEKRACSDNASQLLDVAFFNDSFRDIVKGSTFDLGVKGFASGDVGYGLGYMFAFMGSTVNYCFNQRFKDSTQSLNYVECHDNHTLFDKYIISNGDDKETIYSIIDLSNALTILSFGIPFIHNGQEIGKSKCGLGNTYNIPKVNDFDYKEVDERFEMVKYLSGLLSLRDNELSFFKEVTEPSDIEKMFNIENKDNLIYIKLDKEMVKKTKYQDVLILINVTDDPISYILDDYHQTLLIKGGLAKREDLNIKNGRVAPHSVDILVR